MPVDWIVGHSLGAFLLLREPERVARAGRVALLAPIFAFPREAGAGGRIARAQVEYLARWLKRDRRVALADFYARAGLDVPAHSYPRETSEELAWGLERLAHDRVEPGIPEGWRAWCGADDALLDAAKLHALAPAIAVVAGATHHPRELMRAMAEVAA